MPERKLPKIIAVLGPTSSGKSDLSVDLALAFDGEVVSADSRQVYRGLDIATGKITKEEMRGVPHHLLDVADPKDQYSVSHFKHDAEKAVDDILSRGKLPIVCGGTGLYVQAVVDNFAAPESLPDESLRRELAAKTTEELFSELQKLDPERAKDIDAKNPRRLVRAIEISRSLGFVPKIPATPKKYDAFEIAIKTDPKILRERIMMRLDKRLENGMVDEARRLHAGGLSYERMEDIGLEYRFLSRYLRGKISEEEMKQEISFKNWQYAKRQMTWLRRNKKIRWFSLEEKQRIFEEVKKFLD